jgi:glycosyltransferase involved in cell wall biosynthesis
MISVIVLSRNNGDTLDGCLRSIIHSYGDKEIIVVDANSSDGTSSILEKYQGKINVFYDEGKGIGIARNIGVARSRGDIVCFVDADAVCSKDHFIKIAEFFDEHPEVGVINVHSDDFFSEDNSCIQRLEAKIRRIREGSKYAFGRGESLSASGCFISFRKKVFEEVGGFWVFPPYGADDNDFSMKALAKGWKIGVIRLRSQHYPRVSLRLILKEMWGWGKGKACFVCKWRKHPLAKTLYKRSFLSKLVGNDPLLVTIAAYFLAPIIAARYAIEGRSLSLYPYYVVRQCASFLGLLWGLTTWARKI